jgi:hypothetical protein
MNLPKVEHDGNRRGYGACLSLIQSAHINLYRDNTFRITGLPVDASEKEIKKHADKLKMLEELGYGHGANPAAFALDPPPSVDKIREAIQRLKEPEHRLVDEFFWFWPLEFGKSANDPAIQAILNGDSGKAYDIWTHMESSPEHDFIAWHNIAIMCHLIALDWTDYHISSEVDEEREGKIKRYWKESFDRWEKITADDRIWDALKARIRDLDDPRLTTGFARRMRDTFPEALDKINAEIALRFAEQGRTDWAKIHIDFMNETHHGLDDVEKTATLVLTPTRNRVLQHIQTAKEEVSNNPKNGALVARKLIEQCRPLQNLFELFFGSEFHHKTELFDDVASTLNSCLIQYSKKTDDFSENVILLKETLQFATSIDLRQLIQKNIHIGEGNLRHKELEPFYAEIKKIQDSKEKAQKRFEQLKLKGMPNLLAFSEKKANQKELIDEMSDAIAIASRSISIDAHNNEKDYRTAVEAIRLAAKLAKDSELKKRISDDLKVVEESFKDSMCHYCGKNMAQLSCANNISMFGDITRHWGSVNYRHTKISVPRCAQCNECHNKQEHTGCGLWVVFLLLGIGGGGVFAGDGGLFIGGFIAFFAGWLLSVIVKSVMRGSSGLKLDRDHPRIQELLVQGWKFGDKPGKYD